METAPTSHLDSEGAAKYLGVSRRAVESWRQRGLGPSYLKIGSLVRYTIEDLDTYLDSARVVPNGEG